MTKPHLSILVLLAAATALAAGTSTRVDAQCGQRDVSGYWRLQILDSAGGEAVELKQAGTTISGRASLSGGAALVDFYGKITGTVDGERINFDVEWSKDNSRLTESFEGTFGPDGRISGTARIWSLSATVPVRWKSDRAMRCLNKKVGSLGVKHTDPGDPNVAVTAPWTTAAPQSMILPRGVATGQSNVVWDAGKSHPYAEVWVRVDGQDERKLLEQGKGSLAVAVEAGRTYVYILTDSGKTLATVTVRFTR